MRKLMTQQEAITLLANTDLNKLNKLVDRKNKYRDVKLPYITADKLNTFVHQLPKRK